MKRTTWGILVLVVCLGAGRVLAQSSTPFVVEGPTIIQDKGCALAPNSSSLETRCISVAYPQGSVIATKRLVMVPRGNLVFEFPVVSNVSVASSRENLAVAFDVTVTVKGPNAGETQQATGNKTFSRPGSAKLQVPINVDWAESVVTFQINLSQNFCFLSGPNTNPECPSGSARFTGPNLSAISPGLSFPTTLPNDGFLVVATPAAAFQLPIVPTTILYGPLGNGSKAQSVVTITNIIGTNQQFVTTTDSTWGEITDDKTQYTGGANISIGGIDDAKNNKVSLGVKFSGSWDNVPENDFEATYGTTSSVVNQDQLQVSYTIVPTKTQPPLDQVSYATQPFWQDVILAVTDAQYAIWDYPQGPVIQPLGSVSMVMLPLQQLDNCTNTPNAIEPTSVTPQNWAAKTQFAAGAIILDSNNNVELASTGGTSGAAAPNWSTASGGSTTDGTVQWSNQTGQFVVYKGSLAQTAPQYLRLGTWKAGQAFAKGALVLGPDSIEVATTAGTSGTATPTWNAVDGATTPDGSVVWTNEQEHFAVYAGSITQAQSVYQWMTSENCSNIASLDQFYVNKSQSASPVAYRVLGNHLSLAPPSNPNTYSNQNQTVSSVSQTTTIKWTSKVTAIAENSNEISGSVGGEIPLEAGVLVGLSASGSWSQDTKTTTSFSAVDSQSLQTTTTNTGQASASTAIQDTGAEQSIPVNVLQDSIFMGVAVQDTNMHFPPPPKTLNLPRLPVQNLPPQIRTLAAVHPGRSPAGLRKPGVAGPTTYVQHTNYGFDILVQRPTNAQQIKTQIIALHAAAAARHTARPVSAAAKASAVDLTAQDTLVLLKRIQSPELPVQNAIKEFQKTGTPQ